MREPALEPVEENGPESESKRRSQRPPRPLTHRMDLRAARAALFQMGLLQPELEPQKPPRNDRSLTRIKPTSAPQPLPEMKETTMQTEETTTSTKPGVGGTQQTHTSKVIGEIGHGQKCLMYGGTAVVSGSLLMLAWKGLTKWLG